MFQDQVVAYRTIVRREVIRFMRIWPQTLFPPVVTQTLYFVIFGKLIGSRIGDVQGVTYMAFIVPGLVMMSVINSSYSNVVSSFFGAKFQRSIEEIMVSPTSHGVIIAGYVTGAVLRGILVGIIVFCVSVFFTRPVIFDLGIVAMFIILTAIVFALGGLINAILATRFDDISIVPVFVLTPLTYLGGVFYSIQELPPFWQVVAKFNPILYMVNGFRFGFYGFSDVNLNVSVSILIFFAVILTGVNLYLLEKGVGLRT